MLMKGEHKIFKSHQSNKRIGFHKPFGTENRDFNLAVSKKKEKSMYSNQKVSQNEYFRYSNPKICLQADSLEDEEKQDNMVRSKITKERKILSSRGPRSRSRFNTAKNSTSCKMIMSPRELFEKSKTKLWNLNPTKTSTESLMKESWSKKSQKDSKMSRNGLETPNYPTFTIRSKKRRNLGAGKVRLLSPQPKPTSQRLKRRKLASNAYENLKSFI